MNKFILALFLIFSAIGTVQACSILYYIDPSTGKIYALTNEDYYYHVKPYISIIPRQKNKMSRLWYGWKNFAQGGINEAGLFFDAAVTPKQPKIKGYKMSHHNLGDQILATCTTTNEAVAYLETHHLAYPGGHLLFGDSTGNAVIVEWVEGKQQLIPIQNHQLLATNFLIGAPQLGNYPCPRYQVIQQEITRIEQEKKPIDLLVMANIIAKAIQPAAKDEEGKLGGTLYSSFINITDMQMVLMYKYDNNKLYKFDLKAEFAITKRKKIKLN